MLRTELSHVIHSPQQLTTGGTLHRVWPAFALLAACGISLSACRAPDTQALKKIACEQAAASLDMQSVSQMDALRKALGLAPDVDPIRTCTELGADMKPGSQAPKSEEEASN
jgi:hypothetical protein